MPTEPPVYWDEYLALTAAARLAHSYLCDLQEDHRGSGSEDGQLDYVVRHLSGALSDAPHPPVPFDEVDREDWCSECDCWKCDPYCHCGDES